MSAIQTGHVFKEKDFGLDREANVELLLKDLNAVHFGHLGLTANLLEACAWAIRAAFVSNGDLPQRIKIQAMRKNLLRSWNEPAQPVALGHLETLEKEEKKLFGFVQQRERQKSRSWPEHWPEDEASARLAEVRSSMTHWRRALEVAPSAVVGVAQ
jgi:hypothetical protein